MSVGIRPYRRGGWQVDIRLVLPDGRRVRERKVFRTASKSAAQRWGQDRERHLLMTGSPTPTKEVPTLEVFAPRFLEGHARANRQKPSTIAAKEMILRVHLIPRLGSRRLDTITNEQVQQLKRALSANAAKTVNNVLTVLNVLLKTAVEWAILKQMPCAIRLLRVPKSSAIFYDFEDYEQLVDTARRSDWQTYLIVLLGGVAVRGDAGAGTARCGPHQTPALRGAVRLGRVHYRAERGTPSIRPAHGATRGGAA